MKMPWVTSSGSSPASPRLELGLQPPHPLDRLLEGLGRGQLAGVVDLLRLEPERLADRLRRFRGRGAAGCVSRRVTPCSRSPAPAACACSIPFSVSRSPSEWAAGSPLRAALWTDSPWRRRERPHSAAGAAPATTLTKFSRCLVVQHSKAPSQ